MASLNPIISLLTDFGQSDGYIGAMQGVILKICPSATITHVSHDIPPQDIQAGAFVLYQSFGYYPPYAVHCVVVDPGVGGERRAIAVRTSHGVLVGPDNGVFSLALSMTTVVEAVELTNPRYQLPFASTTFHGRDIFAPAAAHLAASVPLTELGEPVTDLKQMDFGKGLKTGQCRVIHIDHFGNIVLDITAKDINDPEQVSFKVGDKVISSLSRTFADVPEGELLAYVGSTRDHVEIAVRNGSAARTLELRQGDVVQLNIKAI